MKRIVSLLMVVCLLFGAASAAGAAGTAADRKLSVTAIVRNSTSESFRVGDIIAVGVGSKDWPAKAAEVSKAVVEIASGKTGYASGVKELKFEKDGKSMYYNFDTWGLDSSDDYIIKASVVGKDGSSYSESLQMKLLPFLFEKNVLESVNDIKLPFMNMGLYFKRTYRIDSRHQLYWGEMGNGWFTSLSLKLCEGTDGTITFVDDNGNSWYYKTKGAGIYDSAPSDKKKLTRDPDGSFQLRYPSGAYYRFKSNLLLDYISDQRDNKIQYKYDKNNRVTSLKDSSGQTISIYYDKNNRIQKIKDSAGREASYAYDSQNNLSMMTDPEKNKYKYYYNPDNRLAKIVYPDERVKYYEYDKGYLVMEYWSSPTEKAPQPLGKLKYSFDDKTGYYSITDAAGREWRYKMNNYQKTTEMVSPEGEKYSFNYDKHRLTSIVNPRGDTWKYETDAKGNPTKITDPLGNTVSISYSEDFGTVTKVVDANGRVTTYEYNEDGEPTVMTLPDKSAEIDYHSTENGREQVEKKLRNNDVIVYSYDKRGLPVQKKLPDGTEENYEYDLYGNLVKVDSRTMPMQFEYDKLSRLKKTTYGDRKTLTYEYDAMGRRTGVKDPEGTILHYAYDATGKITEITSNKDGLVARYEYDTAGYLSKKTLGNGVAALYQYDNDGRLKRIENADAKGQTLSYVYYKYDSMGNCISKDYTWGKDSYKFDKIGRLIEAKYKDGTVETYKYDPLGNRTEVAVNGKKQGYQRNELNQYTKVGDIALSYDKNGNLTEKVQNGKKTTFKYDAQNKLVEAVLSDGTSVAYTYDSLGRLVQKKDKKGVTDFCNDMEQIALEYNQNAENPQRYIWGAYENEILYSSNNSKSDYYLLDGLKSVTERTDTNSSLTGVAKYKAFGELQEKSDTLGRFQFTGAYYEPETGMYYMDNRWYDPRMGRYTAANPLGIEAGFNAYSFLGDNPVTGSMQNLARTSVFGAGSLGNSPAADGLEPKIEIDTGGWADQDSSTEEQDNGGFESGDDAGGGGGGACPTFIQSGRNSYASSNLKEDTEKGLACMIKIPSDNCLIRSDIPIYGVAYGEDFKKYRVEYGKGTNPESFDLIFESETPQKECGVDLEDIEYMQGDNDLHGNLATWNTGLTEWEHLPWHPAEDPTDFKGIYTIRLVVENKAGETIEDRISCEIGNAIAQCRPGTVTSSDGKVKMIFREQSLMSPFRIFSILPAKDAGEQVPGMTEGMEAASEVYRVRDPGELFSKDITLEFKPDAFDKESPGTAGIFVYDNPMGKWKLLDTSYDPVQKLYAAKLDSLPAKRALFVLMRSTDGKLSTPIQVQEKQTPATREGGVLIEADYNTGLSPSRERDRYVGARLSLEAGGADGSGCLKVSNPNFGGSYSFTLIEKPWDIQVYNRLSFDYKIGPDVKTDLYIKVAGKWYCIGFTGDTPDFTFRDVNMVNLGSMEGVNADGNWHKVSVDLLKLLRAKTMNTVVEEAMFACWNVSGYMKLDFGKNARDAAWYLDNLKISGSGKSGGDLIRVDSFDKVSNTNMLGGAWGVYGEPADKPARIAFVFDGSKAARISFDLDAPKTYAGYWTSLKGTRIDGYQSFSMKLKNSSDGGPLYVGMRDTAGKEASVELSGFKGTEVADGFRTIEVPLGIFRPYVDLANPDLLFISGQYQDKSMHGEVVIDDLCFVNTIPEYVSDFEKTSDANLIGGKYQVITNGAAALATAFMKQNYPARVDNGILRLSYGGSIGLDYGPDNGGFSYAVWHCGLDGMDLRQYRAVSLRIRGEKGGETPNFYLSDGTRRVALCASKLPPIQKDWITMEIPVAYFADRGVDITHTDGFQIVFEWKEQTGTIYVDDIKLVK